MTVKKKILFVCTINRMKSATAHEIFKNDSRFEVNSAGTDSGAARVLTQKLLDWADSVIVIVIALLFIVWYAWTWQDPQV